jgi:DNA-directed RNA polymerase subunit RPC12/RpoP
MLFIRQKGRFVQLINSFMFTAVKETIWHLTCIKCKNWFTYATMEDKMCIDRYNFHCPHCGSKGRCAIDDK